MALTNTLGGYSIGQIAQETIEPLMVAMFPFRAITTNFSDEIAQSGSTVATRLPTLPTFASLATGYSTNAQNATLTSKTCTLGEPTGAVLGFSDFEYSVASIDLGSTFIRPLVNGVANDAMDDVLALCTQATFSTAAFTGAASTFDSDDVSDLAKTLSNNNVPRDARFLILEPDYINALRKDNALLANTYGGTENIRDGRVPRLFGFDVYEYSDVYDTANEVGFCGHKSSLLIASRVPAVPSNFPGEIATVTDPESGFSLQIRRWYSADDGRHYLSAAAMWGVIAGNASAGERLVSS